MFLFLEEEENLNHFLISMTLAIFFNKHEIPQIHILNSHKCQYEPIFQ